ncbi:hypothetical protein FRC09_013111 [Ceratobasidium sp. 395]|nr:hypothetical protein FRC09_013111 [Ceratobasidium sp. 395]
MIFSKTIVSAFTAAAITALGVAAKPGETHTVEFPQLQRNGKILSNGEPYTQHGGRLVANAWLQTPECNEMNGNNCTLILIDLENGTESNNAKSSTEIYLVPPQYKFSVPVKFQYYGPCNGGNQCLSASCCPQGARCSDQDPDDQAERLCLGNNANVRITFCPK